MNVTVCVYFGRMLFLFIFIMFIVIVMGHVLCSQRLGTNFFLHMIEAYDHKIIASMEQTVTEAFLC